MSSFTGTWDVVSSPDFDEDYLHMEGRPYVKLSQEGKRVAGEYHLGLQTGNIDGRLERDRRVIFSFEGMDEMDPVDGAGTATIEGDRLIFTLCQLTAPPRSSSSNPALAAPPPRPRA